MLYKGNIQTKIVIFIMAFIFWGVMGTASADTIVIKEIKDPIDKNQVVHVVVQNDDYEGSELRKIGSEETFIEVEIYRALNLFGFNKSENEANSDLKVECHFSHGWGMPRLTRHFGIKMKFISRVNIKIIDVSKGGIIGEVEYIRSWSKANPNPNDFIFDMLNKLFFKKAP